MFNYYTYEKLQKEKYEKEFHSKIEKEDKQKRISKLFSNVLYFK